MHRVQKIFKQNISVKSQSPSCPSPQSMPRIPLYQFLTHVVGDNRCMHQHVFHAPSFYIKSTLYSVLTPAFSIYQNILEVVPLSAHVQKPNSFGYSCIGCHHMDVS